MNFLSTFLPLLKRIQPYYSREQSKVFIKIRARVSRVFSNLLHFSQKILVGSLSFIHASFYPIQLLGFYIYFNQHTRIESSTRVLVCGLYFAKRQRFGQFGGIRGRGRQHSFLREFPLKTFGQKKKENIRYCRAELVF